MHFLSQLKIVKFVLIIFGQFLKLISYKINFAPPGMHFIVF